MLEGVKVYRRSADGGFERARERAERMETPLLPGLSVALSDLFDS